MKIPFSVSARYHLNRVIRFFRGISGDSFEAQYLALARNVMKNGTMQANRTEYKACSLHGAFLRFDVSKGFPAVTTKKLALKSVAGELEGFLKATQLAQAFEAYGSKVWNQNANEDAVWLANPFRQGEGHLGPVYGVQWRRWPAYKTIDMTDPKASQQLAAAALRGFKVIGEVAGADGDESTPQALLFAHVDQLRECLDKLVNNPTDRRILFHGWNPAVLDEIALPACHILYIFSVNVEKKELSLSLTMRSCDIGLGLPFNSASAAMLLELMGRLSGLTPKWCSISLADAHVYENLFDMLHTQMTRVPKRAPRAVLSDRIPAYATTGVYEPDWLDKFKSSDFTLEGYEHHAPIKAAMAVGTPNTTNASTGA
ncbi:thymidylate synthase [Roseateles asaccharophilus]|uniref:thymidylate synthase n=1 Tax=Roseateles asaccharophilus TaxID=582607 RepID=UPI003835726D